MRLYRNVAGQQPNGSSEQNAPHLFSLRQVRPIGRPLQDGHGQASNPETRNLLPHDTGGCILSQGLRYGATVAQHERTSLRLCTKHTLRVRHRARDRNPKPEIPQPHRPPTPNPQHLRSVTPTLPPPPLPTPTRDTGRGRVHCGGVAFESRLGGGVGRAPGQSPIRSEVQSSRLEKLAGSFARRRCEAKRAEAMQAAPLAGGHHA